MSSLDTFPETPPQPHLEVPNTIVTPSTALSVRRQLLKHLITEENISSQWNLRVRFNQRHRFMHTRSAMQRDVRAIEASLSREKKRYVLRGASMGLPVSQIRPVLKVRLLSPAARVPTYGSAGASGMDVYLPQDVTLKPDEHTVVPLGIALEIPEGFEVQIRPRSSTNKQGIQCPIGTVDQDYRGELSVVLMTPRGFIFLKGERVCQLVLAPVARAEIVQAKTLTETARGAGGFGSTGK